MHLIEGYNNRISDLFRKLAILIFRHPAIVLTLMLIFSIFLIFPTYRLSFDVSAESVLHDSDPGLKTYNTFRERFGTDNFIIVAVESSDIFERDFINKFVSLHLALRNNVPHLEDVTSLVNIRRIKGIRKNRVITRGFLFGYLLKRNPSEAFRNNFRNNILSNQLIRNVYISEDGRFATILLRTQLHLKHQGENDILNNFGEDDFSADGNFEKHYLTYEKKYETVSAVERILKRYDADGFKTYVTGTDVISTFVKDSMARDIKVFIALCLSVICGALYFMFRRASGVLLPVVIVVLTLLSTLGIMVYSGVSIKIPSQIIPSFLLAVCVCDSVHILAIFYHKYDECKDKERAITYALGHSGLPIVLTSLTTAAGLLSFTTASIAPIVDVAIFAGTGVMLGLLYSMTLMPALIAIMPIKPGTDILSTATGSGISRLMDKIACITTTRPKTVLAISFLIVGIAFYFAASIRFSHDMLSWFPQNNPIKIATEKIDKELRGTVNLEVIIDTKKENGILNPDLLGRMDRAASDMESLEIDEIFGGKAFSIATLIKEINRAVNDNDDKFYSIPLDEQTIAQEMVIFENSAKKCLSRFTDSIYSMARFTIKVPFRDSARYKGFLDSTSRYFNTHFPDATISITGMMPLLHTISERVVKSTRSSYAIALVVISILMVILIGNLRIGLLSMIPNLTPIIFALGIMGFWGISIDASTMMAGSIAIGLAVDDTIHFMHVFRRYYQESGSPVQAVHETLQTTGKAIFVTSVVLSSGFFIFMSATMKNMAFFGMITGITIIVALLADYFIAPALMVLVNPDKSSVLKATILPKDTKAEWMEMSS